MSIALFSDVIKYAFQTSHLKLNTTLNGRKVKNEI